MCTVYAHKSGDRSVEDFEHFFQFSVIVCFCRFVAKRRMSKSNMLIPWHLS